MEWNVIVTVRPGTGHEHQLLGALAQFGRFRPTRFPGLCMGRVEDAAALLEALRTDFDDPDYLVVAETLGEEGGVGLVTREQRSRYPFVEAR